MHVRIILKSMAVMAMIIIVSLEQTPFNWKFQNKRNSLKTFFFSLNMCASDYVINQNIEILKKSSCLYIMAYRCTYYSFFYSLSSLFAKTN